MRRNDYYGFARHTRITNRTHEAKLQQLATDPDQLISECAAGPYEDYFVPLVGVAAVHGWLLDVQLEIAVQRYPEVIKILSTILASLRQVGTYAYQSDCNCHQTEEALHREVALIQTRKAETEKFLRSLAEVKLRTGLAEQRRAKSRSAA